MMLNKRFIPILVVFIILLSSMMAVSANDGNVTSDEGVHQTVYVSPDGDDQWGNGSSDAPYLSIGYAVESASNNSRIILMDGVYKGDLNTKIIINKNVIIESNSSGVTINGEKKNYFFNVNKDSSLVLNNIRFINGYTDSYLQLGVINNQGKLLVNNSSFKSMETVMSTFFNEGELIMDNVDVSGSNSKNMALALTNLGKCTISNSKLTDPDSNNLNTVYNFKNITIINSQITSLSSNTNYDEFNYKKAFILIENSTLATIEFENASSTILDSNINARAYFKNMSVYVSGTVFRADSSWTVMSVFYTDFTAKNCVFKPYVSADHSNLNITYSIILDTISGSGRSGYLYAPHNWWAKNAGPSYTYFNNNSISDWAVLTFEAEDNNLSVGTDSRFIASFKWYDGNITTEFKDNESLPYRPISFEAQSGRFLYSSGVISRSFSNYLVGNVLDCNVFAIVDNQRVSLTIGKGLSAYTYFVSPSGTNTPDSGTLEKPFKSIKYAIGRVGNGNTICLLEGVYRNNANSEISVEKNITLVGLGDVLLSRANDKTMFYVREWGSLTIVNAKITVANDDFHNNIFQVVGGDLTLINCSVYDVKSDAVISASFGNEKNAAVNIINSSFSKIRGAVVSGTAKTHVDNSSFEKVSNYYYTRGLESYNTVFSVTSYIEIFNSMFKENTVGIVNLHPFYYSSASNSMLGAVDIERPGGIYAYVVNSTFIGNVFNDIDSSYTSNGVGFNIYDRYGSFDGCIINSTFRANKGKIAVVNQVVSSSFINNTGQAYGGQPLVEAVSIEDSLFVGNLNQYVDGDGAYIGEGIASANSILNSTFINNRASFGGAVSNTKTIHYCVFVNNTAKYAGNDVYSAEGDVDYSTNWWGDNQKPDSQNIFIFLGNLKLTDWVVMSLESRSAYVIEASLDRVMDIDGNIRKLEYSIPVRPVYFRADGANVTPEIAFTYANTASANLSYDENASDFKAYAIIDNQMMDVDVRNSNTRIIMENVTVKGSNGKFEVDLINVNGYKISNQTLFVELSDSNGTKKLFNVLTDDNGHASFDIDCPVGKYEVLVTYLGNGFFEKSNATAQIEVIVSNTRLISYNYTYYGKNNKFHGILQDENGRNLVNFPLSFTIEDSNGNSKTIVANTDIYGRADVILSLDLGEYDIRIDYLGDSWYMPSSSSSHIVIKPANTVIVAENKTLHGIANEYGIILKDVYGNLISEENIEVTISDGKQSDKFILKTGDDGVARLTINYVPGLYTIKASYLGDKIYSPSSGEAVINIEKVQTMVSGFHYKIIPLNGFYTVVLSDIYGHRISNETVTLNCYRGQLIKTFTGTTDANGEVSFCIDLDEATYLATLDYEGSTWYEDSTNAATIVVSKDVAFESIHINSTDLVQYYGENKFFIIEFNDPNAYSQYGKTIVVTIASKTWSKAYEVYTDAFGMARLQIKLDPGEYNITYRYSNPYYDIYGNGSNKITVFRMPVLMLANDLIIKSAQNNVYEVSLRDVNNIPLKNLQVLMEINGEEHVITTNDNGIASLLVNLDIGEYNITYSVDNPNYLPASGTSRIMVVDSDKTSSKLVANDVEARDDEVINLTVMLRDLLDKPISASKIYVEILDLEGQSVKNVSANTDRDGFAVFNVNLEYGSYLYRAAYWGNDLYLASGCVNTINVQSSDNRTKTVLFKSETKINKNERFYISLADVNGTPLQDRQIRFSIGNETYLANTDGSGKAYLNANLIPGKYVVKAVFDGDESYKPVYASANLVVTGSLTQLNAQKLVKYYRNGTQFHAQLLDKNDRPMAKRTVSVILDNATYNCTTDENGWITLAVDLKPGHYDVECYYLGENPDENSFDKTTIDVLMTVIGHNEIKYYGQTPYMSFKFLNGAGELIKNTEFVIGVDGKNYVARTDSEGIFDLNIVLDSGMHVISANNPYDGLYVNYTLEILPTIETNSIVKVLGDGWNYLIRLYDTNGSVLANASVDIIIDGLKHVKTSDSNGEIRLNMEMTPKTYLVTVINPVSKEYAEKSIKVLHPISQNKDLTMYYNSGSKFTVRILTSGGKPIGEGKTVTFKVAGKTYNVKTDKNGYASLKINLKPGSYKIISKYKGRQVSNKITVKPTLITKNVNQNSHTVKFTAKLLNNKGKVLSGKKVTFKFKNKKYTAKTNSKGIATIKLTLKKGKYSITSSYGSMNNKNTIVIKK